MTVGGRAPAADASGADVRGNEKPVNPYRPPSSSDRDTIFTTVTHQFVLHTTVRNARRRFVDLGYLTSTTSSSGTLSTMQLAAEHTLKFSVPPTVVFPALAATKGTWNVPRISSNFPSARWSMGFG
jgi:hypothetical protein